MRLHKEEIGVPSRKNVALNVLLTTSARNNGRGASILLLHDRNVGHKTIHGTGPWRITGLRLQNHVETLITTLPIT